MKFPYTARITSLARNTSDMTQEEFASLLGISVHTLRNWEQGIKKPLNGNKLILDLLLHFPERTRSILEEYKKLPKES